MRFTYYRSGYYVADEWTISKEGGVWALRYCSMDNGTFRTLKQAMDFVKLIGG